MELRTPQSIKIVAPLCPFVEKLTPAAINRPENFVQVNSDVRAKYEAVVASMDVAGFSVIHKEWETRHYDDLGGEANAIVELMHTCRIVNGKPLNDPSFHSFSGQAQAFMWHYLDAPVSAKEVSEDAGRAGNGHDPGGMLKIQADETQFRYFLGPFIREAVETYNSLFDATGADLVTTQAICYIICSTSNTIARKPTFSQGRFREFACDGRW